MDIQFISRKAPKWIVDRFEESWAVLENSETREIISLPIATLPKNIKPGSTLIKHENKWFINEAESTKRQSQITERFNRIKRKNFS